jgi:hypothetical protein
MAATYNTIGGSNHSPYGSGDPYYNESSGFITPLPAKKRTSNWIKIGVPVLILVIIGAVVGGVLGSRSKSKSNAATSSAGGDAAASSAASIKLDIGRFATATNSEFMMPIYPSTVSNLFYRKGRQSSANLFRQTQQPLHHQRFSLPQSQGFLGPRIRSNRQIQTCLPYDPTVLVSSPLHTNGRPYLNLSRMIHICRVGIIPYLAMLQITSPSLPFHMSWMAAVAS